MTDTPSSNIQPNTSLDVPSSRYGLQVSIAVFSRPGNSERANEDMAFGNYENCIAGVCDGVSDIVGFRTPEGHSGGFIASKLAAETFAATPPDQSLVDSMVMANSSIASTQKKYGVDVSQKPNRFATTAAVARVRQDVQGQHWLDLLQVADSVAIVVYDNGHAEAPLGISDQDAHTLQLWRQLAVEGLRGMSIRHDARMESQISAKRSESNVTYGVMNGEPKAIDFVQQVTIPTDGVNKVILLTDGMLIPKEDATVFDEWPKYAHLEAEGGLEAIYDYVRELEASDPDLVRYPRIKLHDDASGTVLELTK